MYPNFSQKRELLKARGKHCFIYNSCVGGRQWAWQAEGRSISYCYQQNLLPEFKKENPEFALLGSQALQATVKRVDLAYQAFFKGLRKRPKFKPLRKYSGWSYPGKAGWKAKTNGKNGWIELRDLGITVKMRGKAKQWGIPTTLTIVYKPSTSEWFASFTVEVLSAELKFGSKSNLEYESIIAYDLGTTTALTTYDGNEYNEIVNPRFIRQSEQNIKTLGKRMRRKDAPKKNHRPSRRWKKVNKQVSKLQRKVGNQRKNWQHQVTSDITSRYDIGVTEELQVKNMTRKAKKGSKMSECRR